jgi:hypothetical protein
MPSLVRLTVSPKFNQQADRVAVELAARARTDANRCMGYFPSLSGQPHIKTNLPESRRWTASFPSLTVFGLTLRFNFLRLSLVSQDPRAQYHLDTDAATALTGSLASMQRRFVWRLLINLSRREGRRIGFLDVDPSALALEAGDGYVYCPTVPDGARRELALPPRSSGQAWGALLCTNRILHSGRDGEAGHFIAAYGMEANERLIGVEAQQA